MNSQVQSFIEAIADDSMRRDSLVLCRLMQEETGQEPYLWAGSIIGFGTHHYKYESGREGDTVTVGFAPRKQALTLYGVVFYDQGTGLLGQLGKHKTGKGCLYIKQLSDVDESVLRKMVRQAYDSKTQPEVKQQS